MPEENASDLREVSLLNSALRWRSLIKLSIMLCFALAVASTTLVFLSLLADMRFEIFGVFFSPLVNEFVSTVPFWLGSALLYLLYLSLSKGGGSRMAAGDPGGSHEVHSHERESKIDDSSPSQGTSSPDLDGVIVEARNVHKVYKTGKLTVHALRGINLRIRKGEMVAIMGPSGCGKTTLLNCFSGLDDPTEGEVCIDGFVLNSLSDNEKTEYRAKRMGFIFQSYNLLPILNAVENVELPLLVAGVPPEEAREKAMQALEMVDLKDWWNHKPAEMSAGQQQRVAIARALVNRPAIVWADEPTGNLDQETSVQIVKLLCDLNKANRQTFVLVTHDQSIAELTDRILRMRSGRIVEEIVPQGGR